MAACQGGRLVVHFISRKNAPFDFPHDRGHHHEQTLTYDANGNLTTDGTVTYNWDARNRLVGLSSGASFAYDALGRRASKTISGTMTSFVYEGLNLAKETTASGTTDILAGLGIDEHLLRIDATGTVRYVNDALSSTVALIDSVGAVQAEYTYEPFGAASVSGSPALNAMTFTGRENDGTGLMYYRERYYYPRLQRFISSDPMVFDGGDTNLYTYVRNAPTNWSDPTGEFAWALGPGIGFFVGGGVDLGLQLYNNDGNRSCVDWTRVGISGLIGAAAGATGPGGPFFGRLRYGAPRWWGNVNTGNFRLGWSWNGGRNWFGPHGGVPNTPGHWHWTPVPGPGGPADWGFGIGGGTIGGASGGKLSGRGKCESSTKSDS